MKINNKRLITIGSFFLCCFLILALCVFLGVTQSVDEIIGTIFSRTDFLTSIMRGITFLGEGTTLILLGVLIVIFLKKKKDGALLFLNLILVGSTNSILKLIIRRPRPLIEHLVIESGFSFPSGHSASAMAFYGYLIYMTYKKCENKILRNFIITTLVLVIFAIGISRIYLGVHYPSDVLGGFMFGLSILIFYIRFTDWIWSK